MHKKNTKTLIFADGLQPELCIYTASDDLDKEQVFEAVESR